MSTKPAMMVTESGALGASKAILVIAWTVEAVVFDGKPYASDLGKRAGTKVVREARACMWLNEGTFEDMGKAMTHAAKEKPSEGETQRVLFIYALGEKDPLGRARRDVLRYELDRGERDALVRDNQKFSA